MENSGASAFRAPVIWMLYFSLEVFRDVFEDYPEKKKRYIDAVDAHVRGQGKKWCAVGLDYYVNMGTNDENSANDALLNFLFSAPEWMEGIHFIFQQLSRDRTQPDDARVLSSKTVTFVVERRIHTFAFKDTFFRGRVHHFE